MAQSLVYRILKLNTIKLKFSSCHTFGKIQENYIKNLEPVY